MSDLNFVIIEFSLNFASSSAAYYSKLPSLLILKYIFILFFLYFFFLLDEIFSDQFDICILSSLPFTKIYFLKKFKPGLMVLNARYIK